MGPGVEETWMGDPDGRGCCKSDLTHLLTALKPCSRSDHLRGSSHVSSPGSDCSIEIEDTWV